MNKYHCIVCKNFQRTKIYSFHNFSLRFILKIFLKFGKFQPRYSYKIYSFKKERVYAQIEKEALLINLASRTSCYQR